MPRAAAATPSVWLKVRFERVRAVRSFHNGNCGGKDTIKRPNETFDGIREDDTDTIFPKLPVRGVRGFVRLARLRCRHYYVND